MHKDIHIDTVQTEVKKKKKKKERKKEKKNKQNKNGLYFMNDTILQRVCVLYIQYIKCYSTYTYLEMYSTLYRSAVEN